MSVSKWKWTPECDRGICIGDCDLCDKAVFEETITIRQTNATKKLGRIIESVSKRENERDDR